jgi:hypothetical protein
MGIRMSEDGRTVWVGLPNDRQIAAVDAATLAVTARYPVRRVRILLLHLLG